MRVVNILGINLHDSTRTEVEQRILAMMRQAEPSVIVTPNPEIVLHAQTDEEYFCILNQASLSLPDGIGLKFAGFFLGRNLQRYTGVELVAFVLRMASEQGFKILLVNWKKGLSTSADLRQALRSRLPEEQLMIIDTDRVGQGIDYEKVGDFAPEILLCGLGAPWQEKFIQHNLAHLPSVKIAAGIGGAFENYTGKVTPAPQLFRSLGLEWLWRLLKLPLYTHKTERLKRISKAVFSFPLTFFKWRFILPWLFRDNVACLLFQRQTDGYHFLVVERSEPGSHWQIPQGGVDDLSIEAAGAKELEEETGNKLFRIVHASPFLYRYEFMPSPLSTHRGGRMSRHGGYKGQRQAVVIAEYQGTDADIKINYWDHQAWKWVKETEFLSTLHPSRQAAGEIYLKLFKKLIK